MFSRPCIGKSYGALAGSGQWLGSWLCQWHRPVRWAGGHVHFWPVFGSIHRFQTATCTFGQSLGLNTVSKLPRGTFWAGIRRSKPSKMPFWYPQPYSQIPFRNCHGHFWPVFGSKYRFETATLHFLGRHHTLQTLQMPFWYPQPCRQIPFRNCHVRFWPVFGSIYGVETATWHLLGRHQPLQTLQMPFWYPQPCRQIPFRNCHVALFGQASNPPNPPNAPLVPSTSTLQANTVSKLPRALLASLWA